MSNPLVITVLATEADPAHEGGAARGARLSISVPAGARFALRIDGYSEATWHAYGNSETGSWICQGWSDEALPIATYATHATKDTTGNCYNARHGSRYAGEFAHMEILSNRRARPRTVWLMAGAWGAARHYNMSWKITPTQPLTPLVEQNGSLSYGLAPAAAGALQGPRNSRDLASIASPFTTSTDDATEFSGCGATGKSFKFFMVLSPWESITIYQPWSNEQPDQQQHSRHSIFWSDNNNPTYMPRSIAAGYVQCVGRCAGCGQQAPHETTTRNDGSSPRTLWFVVTELSSPPGLNSSFTVAWTTWRLHAPLYLHHYRAYSITLPPGTSAALSITQSRNVLACVWPDALLTSSNGEGVSACGWGTSSRIKSGIPRVVSNSGKWNSRTLMIAVARTGSEPDGATYQLSWRVTPWTSSAAPQQYTGLQLPKTALYGATCGFETTTYSYDTFLTCGWGFPSSRVAEGTKSLWQRGTRTPSYHTGPSRAHSGANFMYLETSAPSVQGMRSELTLQEGIMHALANYSMSFFYHMHGSTMGTLALEAELPARATHTHTQVWRRVWSMHGEQHARQAAPFTRQVLRLPPRTTRLRFVGVAGDGHMGDMAIDSVLVAAAAHDAVHPTAMATLTLAPTTAMATLTLAPTTAMATLTLAPTTAMATLTLAPTSGSTHHSLALQRCAEALDLATLSSPYVGRVLAGPPAASSVFRGRCRIHRHRLFYMKLAMGAMLRIGQTENSFDSRHAVVSGPDSSPCPTKLNASHGGTHVCMDDPDAQTHTTFNGGAAALSVWFILGANDGVSSGTFTLAWNVTTASPTHSPTTLAPTTASPTRSPTTLAPTSVGTRQPTLLTLPPARRPTSPTHRPTDAKKSVGSCASGTECTSGYCRGGACCNTKGWAARLHGCTACYSTTEEKVGYDWAIWHAGDCKTCRRDVAMGYTFGCTKYCTKNAGCTLSTPQPSSPTRQPTSSSPTRQPTSACPYPVTDLKEQEEDVTIVLPRAHDGERCFPGCPSFNYRRFHAMVPPGEYLQVEITHANNVAAFALMWDVVSTVGCPTSYSALQGSCETNVNRNEDPVYEGSITNADAMPKKAWLVVGFRCVTYSGLPEATSTAKQYDGQVLLPNSIEFTWEISDGFDTGTAAMIVIPTIILCTVLGLICRHQQGRNKVVVPPPTARVRHGGVAVRPAAAASAAPHRAAGRDTIHNTAETFYHGTSLKAAVAIQRKGFDTSLAGTNAGAMLGRGVYMTASLPKAITYATGDPTRPHTLNPDGGAVLKLHAVLGKCKWLARADQSMRTWHAEGFDSAFSPGCPCIPTCAVRCPMANGVREEHCIFNATHIVVVDMILGDVNRAKKAGYELRARKLERVRGF